MKDVVLVTGASGYLAGHCILRLLNDGYKVRGSLRSLKRADEVRRWLTKARGGIDPADALSFVEAELTDANSWDATMEAVRYVLHVASPIPSSMPKHPDDLIVPARDGTLNVMRSASRASIRACDPDVVLSRHYCLRSAPPSAAIHLRSPPSKSLRRAAVVLIFGKRFVIYVFRMDRPLQQKRL